MAEPIPVQRPFWECTPGDWCVRSLTSRLRSFTSGYERAVQLAGARQDRTETTTSSDARERNGKVPPEALGAHLTVGHLCVSGAGVFRWVAACGFWADLSRATLAAAPIAERIHQLRQLPQVWRTSGIEVSGLSHRDCNPSFSSQGSTRHL